MTDCVLIVDDEASLREVMQDVLVDEGYDVLTASHGKEGIALARKYRPRTILMDLMMPVMDGATAIRMLKRDPATNRICIIACSAGVNLRALPADLPVDAVLPKPFDLDALIAQIEFCRTRFHRAE